MGIERVYTGTATGTSVRIGELFRYAVSAGGVGIVLVHNHPSGAVVVKPLRAAADDKEVVVRTEVIGRGDPIQLDYRMEKTPGQGLGWKIYNLNVLGVWLVETYRSQFAQEISNKGIEGLIAVLADRNKANAKKG
jgi:hypothetical protein